MEFKLKPGSQYFLITILVILTLYLFYLARSLIVPFLTALILTAISYPVYKKIYAKTNKPRISAAITVLLLMLVIIIPLMVILSGLISEGVELYGSLQSVSAAETVTNIQNGLSSLLGFAGIKIEDSVSQQFLISTIEAVKNGVWTALQYASGQLVRVLFEIMFTLFFMYYLLQHGKKIYKYLEIMAPITPKSKKLLVKETNSNIKALFLGQGLVALVQGALGFIGYFMFGINNPLFWGFVTAIFSFVPLVGAWFVWLPIGLAALVQGNSFGGVGVLIWGAVIVSQIDNVLRPFLVSSFSKIHFLVVLIGVFIGIQAFGLIGVILGPLLITLGITFAKIYYFEHIADKDVKS